MTLSVVNSVLDEGDSYKGDSALDEGDLVLDQGDSMLNHLLTPLRGVGSNV